MSTFKVWLISVSCATLLFFLTAVLTLAFHGGFLVPVILMFSAPIVAALFGAKRRSEAESKLLTALTIAFFGAPLTWLVLMLIMLAQSDI
jgi:hypothetical protein